MRESLRAIRSTSSGVASVLQLSTTVYYQFAYVCRTTLAMHSSMYAAPLCTGVSTLTSGKSLLTAAVSPRANDNGAEDSCQIAGRGAQYSRPSPFAMTLTVRHRIPRSWRRSRAALQVRQAST